MKWKVDPCEVASRMVARPWRAFFAHHGVTPPDDMPPGPRLRELTAIFARIPYENASKIWAYTTRGDRPREPAELIEDHIRQGTGGTCYSLAYAMADLLGKFGFAPKLHLGRAGSTEVPLGPFAPNHAALSVTYDNLTVLCDPGMAFCTPVEIGLAGVITVHANVREGAIMTEYDGSRVRLLRRTPRGWGQLGLVDLTVVPEAAFRRTWQRSFHPLQPEHLFFHRMENERLVTVEDRFITVRNDQGQTWTHRASLAEIATRFGLPEILVERAWRQTPQAGLRSRVKQPVRRAVSSALDIVQKRLRYFP